MEEANSNEDENRDDIEDDDLPKLGKSLYPQIRSLVENFYDTQDIRVRSFNRLRSVFRDRFTKEHGRKPTKEESKQLMIEFIASTKIQPNLLLKYEKQIRDYIGEEIQDIPIYATYLKNIRGIAAILAGGIVSWFDPRGSAEHPANHPSSFWKYAGLAPVNGVAVRREKGKKLEFNIKIRTFCWKIADSFIKQRTEPYRQIYDDAKKIESAKLCHPEEDPTKCPLYSECIVRFNNRAKKTGQAAKKPPCKMHIHRRAARKMVKRFLLDLWLVWRQLEGLPLSESYAVAILGHDKQPSNARNPRDLSESDSSRKPFKFSEPLPKRNPRQSSEPHLVRKPHVNSESKGDRSPTSRSEPRYSRNPTILSEPSLERKPSSSSESVLQRKPQCFSESIHTRSPLSYSESGEIRNPRIGSEPLHKRKP